MNALLRAQLELQFRTRRSLCTELAAAAREYGLPVAYVLAIASRETGIRHIIGDRGHGIGVIQIDTRYHAIAATQKANGGWKTATGRRVLIEYGASMLARDRAWAARNWPHLTARQHLKIAASAYNAGRGGAEAGVAIGNSDARTTNRNYGADVLERMDVFAALLKEAVPQ